MLYAMHCRHRKATAQHQSLRQRLSTWQGEGTVRPASWMTMRMMLTLRAAFLGTTPNTLAAQGSHTGRSEHDLI